VSVPALTRSIIEKEELVDGRLERFGYGMLALCHIDPGIQQ
jgi:hypothetical protein